MGTLLWTYTPEDRCGQSPAVDINIKPMTNGALCTTCSEHQRRTFVLQSDRATTNDAIRSLAGERERLLVGISNPSIIGRRVFFHRSDFHRVYTADADTAERDFVMDMMATSRYTPRRERERERERERKREREREKEAPLISQPEIRLFKTASPIRHSSTHSNNDRRRSWRREQ